MAGHSSTGVRCGVHRSLNVSDHEGSRAATTSCATLGRIASESVTV